MASTSNAETGHKRPLSPHLWHWRWHLSMATSILHRISGFVLSVGTVALAAWFVSAAMGPDAYAAYQRAIAHPVGLVLLFGFTWAFVYHLLNGIRHLYWDAGLGFGIGSVRVTSYLVVVASVALTVLIWVAAWLYKGSAL